MKHFKVLAVAAAAALAFSGAAVAGPQWTFAQGQYSIGDGDSVDDTDAAGLSGSLAFADIWHVQGELNTGEAAFTGDDFDQYELGIGLHSATSDSTDVVIDLLFGNYDFDFAGSSSEDLDYWGVNFGVRSMINDTLEVNGEVQYRDADDFGGGSFDEIGGSLGGRYLFNEAVSVGVTFQFNGLLDDLMTLDVRWAFGDLL